jgi:hypothetical protein
MCRFVLALSMMLILGACSNVEQEKAEPKRTSEKREVPSFTRITMAGIGDLVIHQGEREGVELEGSTDILPYVTTQVTNGTLHIEQKPRGWLESFKAGGTPFIAHLYLKTLEEVTLSGQGNLTSDKTIESQNLTIKVSGSGKVNLTLEGNEFTASIAGSGQYDLKGKVNNQNIQISGTGSYYASNLLSNHTSIDIRGSGQVEVNVQKQLNVIITGAGTVRYLGSPQVTQKLFGAGKIEQIKPAQSS